CKSTSQSPTIRWNWRSNASAPPPKPEKSATARYSSRAWSRSYASAHQNPASPPSEPHVFKEQNMDKSDLAWVTLSTLLVLMMTVPGLSLFCGGLARPRHVLSVLSQVLGTCALALLLWYIYGYSLAFTPGSGVIGGWSRLFFKGLYMPGATVPMPLQGTIPEL